MLMGCFKTKNLPVNLRLNMARKKECLNSAVLPLLCCFKKNVITLDDAIYKNTRLNQETIVRMRYKTGEKTMPRKGCLQ